MSYDSVVRTTPNLVAYWPFNDASVSASAADTVNSLNLTKATGGTLGVSITGSNIDTTSLGLSSCAHIDGTVSSPFVTGSSSLLNLTTKLTYMGWMKFTANVSAAVDSIGRPGISAVRVLNGTGSTSSYRASVVTTTAYPGGMPTMAGLPFNVPIGEWNFIAMTWSQETAETRIYINGILEAAINTPGSISAGSGTAAVKFGGTGVQADLSGWAIVNGVVGASWLRKLYLAGVSSPLTSLALPGATNSGQILHTGGIDGALAAPDEAIVTTPTGSILRIDQYGAQRMDVPRVWPSATDHVFTVPIQVQKQITEQFIQQSQRGHTSDPLYFDGTDFQWSGTSGTFKRSTFALVPSLLSLHRHAKIHKRRSWPLEFACSYGDYIMSQQNNDGQWFVADGSPANTDTFFILGNLTLAILLGGSDLGLARRNQWIAAAEKAASYQLQPANDSYYVNGNLELDTAVALYCLWKITGKQSWKDAYDQQWAKTLYPTNSYLTSAGLGQGNAASAGFGLRDGTSATGLVNGAAIGNDAALMALDSLTGKAYLAESANPGLVALDWDYLGIQINNVLRLWLISRDDLHLKLLNVMLNKVMERLNKLSTTTATGATTTITGGTLAAGTYYYVVTALMGSGETIKSNEVSVTTTGSTSRNTVTWGTVTGATGYRIYRSTTSGSYAGYIEVSVSTSFSDTGAALTGSGAPPTSSNALNWILDISNGSRHPNGGQGTGGAGAVSWLTVAMEVLVWQGKRPDLANYDYGSHWSNKILSDFRTGLTNSGWTNENWFAYQTGTFILLLMGSQSWPGLPS